MLRSLVMGWFNLPNSPILSVAAGGCIEEVFRPYPQQLACGYVYSGCQQVDDNTAFQCLPPAPRLHGCGKKRQFGRHCVPVSTAEIQSLKGHDISIAPLNAFPVRPDVANHL